MSPKPPATYLGATHLGAERCLFRVWAPLAERVDVHLGPPVERFAPLSPMASGYHEAIVEGVPPGCLYRYRLDSGEELPDPASRSQPEGVHGPSRVVGGRFEWRDSGWRGVPLSELVLYEIHVGTFTPEGTLDAAIGELDALRELGVTAIELMPLAEFPGRRNWGYDGVFPFAVESSYGGPEALARFVDACHERGLAVVLDVVYNHLGPEGNVFSRFGPYFTERYRTPWGQALNFDGPESDEVRRFFVDNAIYWLSELHVDALRLDAVHAILDASPRTFLEELALAVEERFPDRLVHLIAESSANDARLVRRRDVGGYGLDAVWNDDFHHALHTLLTGEQQGYYVDYGALSQLEDALRDGFVYSGDYSTFRRRRHGVSSRDVPAERFVVFAQNHDQVGNRLEGDRLSSTLSLEQLKLAASVTLLSPFLPLLFMGEEYGETAPFPYFVSHSDPDLVEAVRRGRLEEFASFGWKREPPDPQSEATFASARLRREQKRTEPGATLLALHGKLLALRRDLAALAHRSKERSKVVRHERERVLELHYWARHPAPAQIVALFHFGEDPAQVDVHLLRGVWNKRLDTSESRWSGPGATTLERLAAHEATVLTLAPWSALVFEWAPGEEAPNS